jgi:iron(II)-dependent oxidoreductase
MALILRGYIVLMTLSAILSWSGLAQDSAVHPKGEQIDAPSCDTVPDEETHRATVCTQRDINEWLADIERWRQERLLRIGHDDADYAHPEFHWTQSNLVQTQMMVHDRYFYDPVTSSYTVDRFLDDLKQRYGGVDSVLIWHVYPNLGIDDRNQFDLFHDLPGGMEGVKKMIAQFHARGVKVLFPIVIWDQGTHAEGMEDWDVLVKELTEAGADGVNGDTLEGVPRVFETQAARSGHPLVSEPEVGLASGEMLGYNLMSWGYFNYGFAPPVSLFKWLESRHMVHVCNRWAHDRTDDLQTAFFNGTGFESWENVWGIWNQITPRDAEALRRIMTIERANAELLTSPRWEPNVLTHHFGVFATRWPGKESTLWTVVNRNAYSVADGIFDVPAVSGARYFDLWHGTELHPSVISGSVRVELGLEANGYGAILETRQDSAIPRALLSTMQTLARRPLIDFSTEWKVLPQKIADSAPIHPAAANPEGMVKIPAGDYEFHVHGVEVEGMNDEGTDVQYPWEPSPRRFHAKLLHMKAFWIDKYPVTNAGFRRFLDATHYHPADAQAL